MMDLISLAQDAAMTDASWLHHLSPFALRLSGGMGLRWYGLSYACGFLIAWILMRWLSKRGATPLTAQECTDAMLALVMGVVVGGRLGYVLFYDPTLLTSFTKSAPWWGVLRLNEGGMASHGGMVGVIVACWWIARSASARLGAAGELGETGAMQTRVPTLHVMDLTAFVATPGLLLGRLANFVNGELLGKIVSPPGVPGPWWAVRFPQERLDWFGREGPPGVARGHAPALAPDQELVLDAMLARVRLPNDTDYGAYVRLLNELQHGSASASRGIAADLAPLIAARHPSQLYQAFAEGIVLTVVLWMIWKRPRTPGMIAAAFLVVYGVLRVVTEFWRLPDSHLSVERIAGLSRGQWLSVVMVLAGIGLAAGASAWAKRKALREMGGWGARERSSA
jgi:phosphatidylglycerol:prolipoprotein diacylglycerol transferase